MSDEKKTITNEDKILAGIEGIRQKYEIENIDLQEEEISFLDSLNDLVSLILNDNSFSITDALNSESFKSWKKNKLSRWIKNKFLVGYKNVFYFLFLATITLFLASQSLSFYAIAGKITFITYVKALLTEVAFIFVSGYRSSGKLQTVALTALRVSVFSLMLFVISAQTILVGTKSISQSNTIQTEINFVQKEIVEKNKEISYYRDIKNWPVTTKQIIAERDKLSQELIKLRKQQENGKTTDLNQIQKYNIYGKAIFRVLLLLISVLITRRLFSF